MRAGLDRPLQANLAGFNQVRAAGISHLQTDPKAGLGPNKINRSPCPTAPTRWLESLTKLLGGFRLMMNSTLPRAVRFYISVYSLQRANWPLFGHICYGLGVVLSDCRRHETGIRERNRLFRRQESMNLARRLWRDDDGQGLVEYTLIVVLVALVFWVAVKNTNIGSGLASGWSKVTACVGSPESCTSSS